MSVCGVLGLSCFLITQSSCLAESHKPQPNKQPSQKQLPQKVVTGTRQVTFKNGITKPMLAYSYLFIKYSPSRFTVSINGQQIDPGQEKAITVTHNKITVQYAFEFGTHRSGTRSAEYSVDENTTTAAFTFGWKKTIRIAIDGTTPISEKELVVA
jgi:hypothetical protein